MGFTRRFPTQHQVIPSLGILSVDYLAGLGIADAFTAHTAARLRTASYSRCTGISVADANELGWAGAVRSSYLSSQTPNTITPSNENANTALKLLPIAKLAMSAFVVAGDEDDLLRKTANCWEQVLLPEEKARLSPAAQEMHATHGMLLCQLATFCTPLRARHAGVEGDILVLRNKAGALFAFAISVEVPRGSTDDPFNAEYGVAVLHAIPVTARA